jgi:hypothetical protein
MYIKAKVTAKDNTQIPYLIDSVEIRFCYGVTVFDMTFCLFVKTYHLTLVDVKLKVV